MINKTFYKATNQGKRASFAPFDFHVHTLGSADVRIGDRYDKLPDKIKGKLERLPKNPSDFADYDAQIAKEFSPGEYYELLVEKKAELFDAGVEGNERRKPAILALTDHNVYKYTCAIAEIARSRVERDGLLILPGVELDVKFKVKDGAIAHIHALCIFAPDVEESALRMAISNALGDPGYRAGGDLSAESLPDFIQKLRHNENYPAMCIAAHVASSRGLQNEVRSALEDGNLMSKLQADIVRLEAEVGADDGLDKAVLIQRLEGMKAEAAQEKLTIAMDVLKIIGECGFDGLQVAAKGDSYHYRRLHRAHPDKGRSVPLISSDAHCIEDMFDCNGATPFLKVPNEFYKKQGRELLLSIRDEALRFGETRTTYRSPDHVLTWLAGIQFKRQSEQAVDYWPEAGDEFYIPLSRNLNCLIGGRGSGKSALLDAIAFVATPDQYKNEADKRPGDRCDWYRRAEATLAGWEVKLCWRSDSDETYSGLQKRAKFASRFFDASHKHMSVDVRDMSGQELLAEQALTGEIEFYRIHEIEAMSQPQLLRRLFDNQRATDLRRLAGQIEGLSVELERLRGRIVGRAKDVNLLTENESSPLRQYARRKLSYEAVNTEAVRADYQAVDSKGEIRDAFAKIVETWLKQVERAEPTEESVTKLAAWFSSVTAKLKDEKVSHPDIESLLLFIQGDGAVAGFEQELLGAMQEIKRRFQQGTSRFESELAKREEALRVAKDSLEAKGLPPNAKGREAKKATFEEAEEALERYRNLISELNVLFGQRKEIADSLELACKEVTRLRKEIAASITSKLASDLDPKVLVIEADAQPLKDQSAFEAWFLKYGRKKNSKNSDVRFKSEIEAGLSPRDLSRKLIPLKFGERSIELDKQEKFSSVLEETCDRLTITRPELEDVVIPEGAVFLLPPEVKNGLIVFRENDQIQGELAIDAALRLDEIIIDDQPIVRLNDRPLEANSTSRDVGELSPGQRCSAILPILLLTGTCPLVIDQPEDNLDNRLVRQVIVNILGSIKLKRQVIVATHNPNLPVLGDAEQVVVLRAVGMRESKIEATGDLNDPTIVQCVTEIMEGGREAFQYRESVYLPHWKGGAAAV